MLSQNLTWCTDVCLVNWNPMFWTTRKKEQKKYVLQNRDHKFKSELIFIHFKQYARSRLAYTEV